MQSPAPIEYFEGIKFNYSFYTTGETKVSLEYCNNNYLRCTGYAYSRAISTSFNGILYALGGINTTNITATGTITSNLFSGSGAGLSNINATNISDGTLAVTRGGTGASNFTVGRLLLGNGTTNITENGNLTWINASNALSITGDINITGAYKINNNAIVSSQWFTSGTTIEYNGGSVGIGTPAYAYKLNVAGTINSSGLITSAGLTSSALITTAGLTSSSLITANAGLTIPSGQRLTSSGTSILTGNVGIGTTNNLNNILQVGEGGRLRISNGTTDYTSIGTIDVDGPNNTQIILSGATRTGFLGAIQHYAAGSGYHAFYTAGTTPLEKLRIANDGKVGIGITNPSTKLHITEDTTNSTTITIQNNIASLIVATPTPTIKVNGNYTQLEFYYTTDTTGAGQTVYNYTIPSGVVCDILIVGGGGGGGRFGGGGGAGGVLFATNVSLTAGQIKVGRGGTGTVNGNYIKGENGADSSLYVPAFPYTFVASGGGGGGTRLLNSSGGNGGAGGCGGGGSQSNDGAGGYPGSSIQSGFAPGFYIYFLSYGNSGGYGRPNVQGVEPSHASGGGGGAGGNGSSYSNSTGGGNGGAGRDYSVQFGTSVGHNGWFAGGGGGNTYQGAGNRGYANGGNGLFGGGGNGGYDGGTELSGDNALANTGGGGGGSKWDGSGSLNGGNGGSGAVIIRYLTPTSISSVNLIRGDTTDGNIDYKIENYNGNYFVKKSLNNVDTEIFSYYRSIDSFYLTGSGGLDMNGTIRTSGGFTGGALIQTPSSIYAGNDITAGNSIYLNGWFSKLGSNNAAWQTQTNIGTYWFIDLTSPLLYGGGNATLNIHNLVVWDNNTGSSFFAVLGFTGSYPQEALKLCQNAKNRGIQIDVGFAYNAYGNPLLYITGSSSNNQMYYRIT